ncbi:MarR family transcriptional regulator [Arthrobacter globiformis]|uniref:MarR family winged helix-turn-helix transcriptional regulator n=1 Tax=Arthrobacter globiformis TaxID=1665 RepID=UPI00397AE29D
MVIRPVGYWVKRLDGALEALLDATLAQLRLTRRQWQVLNTLSTGPATPTELGDALRPFSLADGTGAHERDMASLVQRQLVFLQDGLLALTAPGTALHAKANRLVEAAREDLTAGVGADEYAIAVSVLERMCNNAGRIIAR